VCVSRVPRRARGRFRAAVLSQRTNSPHRAEVQRLFVARAAPRQGRGNRHVPRTTRPGHGRNSEYAQHRRENQPRFYKRLGYVEAGVIPGWTIGPAGETYDLDALSGARPALTGQFGHLCGSVNSYSCRFCRDNYLVWLRPILIGRSNPTQGGPIVRVPSLHPAVAFCPSFLSPRDRRQTLRSS